jgi:hypothetical protein
MRRSSGLNALVSSLLKILPALQQNVPTGCLTFVPNFRSNIMIHRKDKYLLKVIHPRCVLLKCYI